MAESNHTVSIIVAIIGLIGVLGAAVISNWDKLTGHPERSDVTQLPAAEEKRRPDEKRQAAEERSPEDKAPPPPRQVKNIGGGKSTVFQPNLGVGIKLKNLSIEYALSTAGEIGLYSNIFSLKLDVYKHK